MSITESAKKIVDLLRRKSFTLSLAESCTGGWLSKTITDIPGSSQIFKGAVVAYSNEAKNKLLRVSKVILKKYGAVSWEVAYEMAEGVRQTFRSSYSLSVTGIAGPRGDGREKPIGLTFIGFSRAGKTEVFRFQFRGDRNANRRLAVKKALQILCAEISGRKNSSFR